MSAETKFNKMELQNGMKSVVLVTINSLKREIRVQSRKIPIKLITCPLISY